MSERTKPKSYWAEKNDKIAAALDASNGDVTKFTDALWDANLAVMPRPSDAGRWRVLVDGQPAPYAGSMSGRPSGPMDAEEAAEAFLLAADRNADVRVRPATDDEMVISAVLGDPVVKPDPVKVAVTDFFVETDPDLGAVALRAWDKDGNTVLLGMDDATREAISKALGEAL